MEDKGERIKNQIIALERKIQVLSGNADKIDKSSLLEISVSEPKLETKKKVMAKKDALEQPKETIRKVRFQSSDHDPNTLADQLLRTHISNEAQRISQNPDRKPNFLLKPSPPMQIEHERRKNLPIEKRENHELPNQPTFMTEQDILLWKGRRGLEYEKRMGIKSHMIQVLSTNESIALYEKNIKRMQEIEEKRLFDAAIASTKNTPVKDDEENDDDNEQE